MNLFLFPEAACFDNGYGIAVDYAYKILKPTEKDIVVWYTNQPREKMLYVRDDDVVLSKNDFFSLRSFLNVLEGKDRTELPKSGLNFLIGKKFERIHCDEVIFYRALRNLYPHSKISVRFHNCYSRIYDRKKMIGQSLDWKYETKLKNMYRLEREIFQDKNVFKIFLSDEDRYYYTSIFGKTNDSETWAFVPNKELIMTNRKVPIHFSRKLVWYGGVESHKKASVLWFINSIFPKVKEIISDVEFHLYGKNTEVFNSPQDKVFGHGFYDGDGFPEEGALYINPDIIGGGVKLKLMSLFENGIPFISTPYGFEGYSSALIDNHYCHVVEIGQWADYIIKLLC